MPCRIIPGGGRNIATSYIEKKTCLRACAAATEAILTNSKWIEDKTPSDRRRKWGALLQGVLRWTVALILVALIAKYIAERREDFVAVFARLQWHDILFLCVLHALDLGLQSWRGQAITQRLTHQIFPFFAWFRIFLVGRLLNTFMLQAGNLYRAHSVKRSFSLSYSKFVATSLTYVWLDIVTSLALVVGLLAVMPLSTSSTSLTAAAPSFKLALLVFLVWTALAPVGTIAASFVLKMAADFKLGSNLEIVRRWLVDINQNFQQCISDLGMITLLIVANSAALIVTMVIFLVTFWAIDTPVHLWQAASILVLYRLSMVLALTPGNIGVRELAIVGAGSFVGIDATAGLSVALITRVTGFAATLALAIPAVLTHWSPQRANARMSTPSHEKGASG